MAKRITNEQKEEMVRLYVELGSYAAVARKLNMTAATVTKYIKAQQSIKTYSECITPKPIESISLDSVLNFSFLTDIEKQSYREWLKEFGR